MKKYAIRIIGSLCILGALALMFLTPWINIDGLRGKEFREFKQKNEDTLELMESELLSAIQDDDFKDDLRDAKLPYNKSGIKNKIEEINDLLDTLYAGSISFYDLAILSVKAPALITDMNDLVQTDFLYDSSVMEHIAMNNLNLEWDYYYECYVNPDTDEMYSASSVAKHVNELTANTEDNIATLKSYNAVFYSTLFLMGLIALLAVIAAVTNVLNRGRGIKYVFAVLLILLVVGTCVGLPMLNTALYQTGEAMPILEEVTLSITVMPFLAAALSVTSLVLDAFSERKE